MTVTLQTSTTEEKFISQTWVKGNVTSVKQGRVIVLLENHLPSKNVPFPPSFLQKHFGPKDILLVEEPTVVSSDVLREKVKKKYNLDLKSEQVMGWDDISRYRLWPLYQKLFKELDEVALLNTKPTFLDALQTILNKETVAPEIRENALKEYQEIQQRYTDHETKSKKCKTLVLRVKCLTQEYFCDTSFPKSQNSLLACLSAKDQNLDGRVWVIAGQAHGDPQHTMYLAEVNKLIDLLSKTKYMMLNTALH